jgi:protein-L-isoaspartate O-methyltransferase
VLQQATFGPDNVKLNGQLDRSLYTKVNKTLEQAGGEWNRKRQCHVFAQNPRDLLNLDTGRVDHSKVTAETIAQAVADGRGGVMVSQLFPTPPDLAARMVETAQISNGDTILEPSAGTGNLAQAILTAFPLNLVRCVEINQPLSDLLKKQGLPIICGDFLEQNENLGQFDRVVMNPPFANGQDVRHIQHALKFLKPGGRLVALCANGPKQRETLKPLAEESGGWWKDLPADSFKEAGTNVSTAMLVIEN